MTPLARNKRSAFRGSATVVLALLSMALLAAGCGATASPAPRVASAATPEVTVPVAVPAASSTTARPKVVAIDPGHAADESGAAANGIVEKDSNLEMAWRVARLLRAQGIEVVMTRTTDARAGAPDGTPQPLGYNGTRLDLQARIEIANAAHADAFVSLHSNGLGDTNVRGYEVYYNSARPFAERNRVLASAIFAGIGRELRAGGYADIPRAVIDDSCLKMFQGRCFPLFVLGSPRVMTRDEVYRRGGTPEALGMAPDQPSISSPATEMPGALAELLFVSSPADAAMLQDEGAREALARGVTAGIVEFLGADRG